MVSNMWPYNSVWNFGGGPGGGYTPPWQTGGGSQTGSDVPWWVGVGVGLGERLGVWDWAADWLGTGGNNGGGTGGGGYSGQWGGPGTGSTAGTGITGDFLTGFLPPGYQNSDTNRTNILTYYKNLEGAIPRFLEYLQTLGLAAQIVSRLQSGDIFAWPKIVQDLIILFYHDKPKADELAPTVVEDANKNAAPALGGGSMHQMLNQAAALRPVTLPLVPREAYVVPKGYVLVRDPISKQPAVVLKEIARAAGLYKPRAKAPIKASDWKAAKKAKAIERKLSRMLGDSCNYKVTKKR